MGVGAQPHERYQKLNRVLCRDQFRYPFSQWWNASSDYESFLSVPVESSLACFVTLIYFALGGSAHRIPPSLPRFSLPIKRFSLRMQKLLVIASSTGVWRCVFILILRQCGLLLSVSERRFARDVSFFSDGKHAELSRLRTHVRGADDYARHMQQAS